MVYPITQRLELVKERLHKCGRAGITNRIVHYLFVP